MYDKIREHVEFLFQKAPLTARAIELKEELISNLVDRYNDLVERGETEETAYGTAIAGIGDVEELIRGLREQQSWDPGVIQSHQQRSAVLVSISVALFIISIIFPIIFVFLAEETGFDFLGVIGACLMFVCIAGGVGLLVYNSHTRPKYVKMEETIVEDFKEWTANKKTNTSLYRTVQATIWTVTVPLYLILGIFFDAWHPGWLIFVLAPVASQIVRLVMMYREE